MPPPALQVLQWEQELAPSNTAVRTTQMTTQRSLGEETQYHLESQYGLDYKGPQRPFSSNTKGEGKMTNF